MTPTDAQQREMKSFMLTLGRVYPCGYCADTTSGEMKVNPPRVGSRAEFTQWMCELHNEVCRHSDLSHTTHRSFVVL